MISKNSIVILVLFFSVFYWGCEKSMEPVEDDPITSLESGSNVFNNFIIPTGATLISAEFFINVSNHPGNQTVTIRKITTSWDENSVTWNNFGEVPGSYDVTTPYGTFMTDGTGWRSVDILNLVNEWLSDPPIPNYGLLLDEDLLNFSEYFSKEAGTIYSPYLVLTFSGLSDPITIYPIDDAYIWENAPNYNYGSKNNLFSGLFYGYRKLSLVRFDLTIEEEPPAEPECETAFAFGGDPNDCFLMNGFSNWGWSNGPLSEGHYEFDVYAGAGQCDISKGTLVGDVTIDYLNGEAIVLYNMDAGFTMSETHLYVGNDMFPTNKKGSYTVAPGQYPFGDDELVNTTTWSYTVTGLTGDIYVIAHAVVCGDF